MPTSAAVTNAARVRAGVAEWNAGGVVLTAVMKSRLQLLTGYARAGITTYSIGTGSKRRVLPSHGDAVPATLLCAIQCLVRRLHHLIGRRMPVVTLRDADTDRDRNRLPALPALIGFGLGAGAKAP